MDWMSRARSKVWLRVGLVCFGLLVLLAALVSSLAVRHLRVFFPSPTPQPADRLSQPPLPEHPTQTEYGRYLYWLNCMACHGDQGQGLTANSGACTWRTRIAGGAAAMPVAPERVVSPSRALFRRSFQGLAALPPFADASALFEYLRTTHPPQHPGILPDDQYWALSDYLLVSNHRLSPGQQVGPSAQLTATQARAEQHFGWIAALAVLLVVAAGLGVWLARRGKSSPPGSNGAVTLSTHAHLIQRKVGIK